MLDSFHIRIIRFDCRCSEHGHRNHERDICEGDRRFPFPLLGDETMDPQRLQMHYFLRKAKENKVEGG